MIIRLQIQLKTLMISIGVTSLAMGWHAVYFRGLMVSKSNEEKVLHAHREQVSVGPLSSISDLGSLFALTPQQRQSLLRSDSLHFEAEADSQSIATVITSCKYANRISCRNSEINALVYRALLNSQITDVSFEKCRLSELSDAKFSPQMTAFRLVGCQLEGRFHPDAIGQKVMDASFCGSTPLDDDFLIAFIASSPSLVTLDVRFTRFSDRVVRDAVAASNIETLAIDGTLVTDDGIVALQSNRSLRRLTLTDTNTSEWCILSFVRNSRLRSIAIDESQGLSLGWDAVEEQCMVERE